MADVDRTVLVVDDEPDALFLFSMILEGAGFEVRQAPHGRAAVEDLCICRPDVVVTDLMMPVMDGRALIDHVRGDPALHDVPVVLLTANPVRDTDADLVIGKPFRSEDLIDVVRRLCGGRAAASN